VQGELYAVKETFAPLADDQARLAHSCEVRAAAAGVRVPEAVLGCDGEVLVRLGADAVRLYRWVEMAGLDRGISTEQLGRCLARLHCTTRRLETRTHLWHFEPVGRARWLEVTGELDREGAPFAARLAGLVDELVEVEAVFVEPAARILCHCDLFAENVRATPDGGLVVIDWDSCGAASADQELGLVLLEFGLDDDRVAGIHDSYCSAGGPGRIRTVSDLTMPVATVGHITELACRQWLEAPDQAARSHAAGRVEELLRERWNLGVLERVVDLVGG
jgi:hypothetical protein